MTTTTTLAALARKYDDLADVLDTLSTKSFRYGGAAGADVAIIRRALVAAGRAVDQLQRNVID